MILKLITLQNFKNFVNTHSYSFSNLNLIGGDNGQGKTTLGVNSILFTLYGYSEQTLTSLITKGKSNSNVSIDILYNNDRYKIERKIPTDITIYKNENKLNLVNNQEKQLYLNQIFKTLDYFRKFRMIDVKEGINLLESGNISLKETLFSLYESKFNSIRNRLLEKKREREIYNKDKAVIYSHYPSQQRLELLDKKIEKTNNTLKELLDTLSKQQINHKDISQEYNKKIGLRDYYLKQKQNYNILINGDACPTCSQPIDSTIIESMIKNIDEQILYLDNELQILQEELNNEEDILEDFEKLKRILELKKQQLQLFKLQLEGRLKQKDFKYSTRDILIIKHSIEALDTFSSYYLTEWIQTLEPIINSIISKIDFSIKFNINNKQQFNITLFKNGIEFTYKDLSTGQKLILSIAFKLAILLERNETGLIIADEGFSALDFDNLMLVFELFKHLPFQLVCMLHRFESNLDNVNLIELQEKI